MAEQDSTASKDQRDPTLRVWRAVKYFSLNGGKSAPDSIARLDEALQEVANKHKIHAQIRETYPEVFLDFKPLWMAQRSSPEVGLMIEYGGALGNCKGKTIPEVYEDFANLDIKTLAEKVDLEVGREHNPEHMVAPPDINSYAVLLTLTHHLWFPLKMAFFDAYEGSPTKQTNNVDIRIRAEVDEQKKAQLEQLLKQEGCESEIITGKKTRALDSDGLNSLFDFHEPDGGMYWGEIAPEAIVRATWQGPDFDFKALDLYGKVGKLLQEEYRKTSLEYAKAIMNAYASCPGDVSLNQEGINQGRFLKGFACHLRCEMPIQVGEKKLTAHLYHNNFRGDSSRT